ncbi:MAG: hypothetical protein H6709_14220 [Kofleriaceae bacterium]|nr:hypothetical protein [Kofleriaceae bacterium]
MKPPPSMRHWNDEPTSVAVNVNAAATWLVGSAGPLAIVVGRGGVDRPGRDRGRGVGVA